MKIGSENTAEKGSSSSVSHVDFRKLDVAISVVITTTIVLTCWYVFFYTINEPQFWQSYVGKIRNPLDKSELMTIVVNLESSTFGAQDKVTAFVTLYSDPNIPHQKEKNIPKDHYLINFDKTSCDVPVDHYQVPKFCSLPLKPAFNFTRTLENQTTVYYNVIYKGQTDVYFTYGDNFDVYLSKESISANVTSDTTQTNEKFIHISPVQATESSIAAKNTFQTSKYAFGAGVGAAIIASVNLYHRYKEKKNPR